MDRARPSPSSARPILNGAVHSHDHGHNHAHERDYAHLDGKPQRQAPAVAVSLLQPRVAILLGLPKRWYRTLFLCRLLCLVPCAWWGTRLSLRFLVARVLRRRNRVEPYDDASLRLIETGLALLWSTAAAVLAYYFTDGLMSRWLINYTPQATVVRLLTVSCVFAYLTSWIVYVMGGSQDPQLLLPAWIGISTILTACYHFTQRKVPIHKETFTSISIFSIASFISMLVLLYDSYITRPFPDMDIPLFFIVKKTAEISGRIVVKILGVNKEMRDGSGWSPF
ncbi:N-glycosylation protein-domain-containing protein [Xylaria sp. FL0043]|nr:N-glycosylation protein-domain-containing protein [Xylaria sp. FL0043]